MSAASRFQLFWLTHFSKPASNRQLYRLIAKSKLKNIVEIGIGSGERAARMIAVALRRHSADDIRYTGIDTFEAGDGSRISLKEAHRVLRATGIRPTLSPGQPCEALRRVAAGGLEGIELLILSGEHPPQSLGSTWWYVPRMLAAGARIFTQSPGEHGALRQLTAAEIKQLSLAAPKRSVA